MTAVPDAVLGLQKIHNHHLFPWFEVQEGQKFNTHCRGGMPTCSSETKEARPL